jgi:hypothetical protein
MSRDQQDGGREGDDADEQAAVPQAVGPVLAAMEVMKHDAVSAVRPDHAIGMIGVAALIAMPAKTSAPANERRMRLADSKWIEDMVASLR